MKATPYVVSYLCLALCAGLLVHYILRPKDSKGNVIHEIRTTQIDNGKEPVLCSLTVIAHATYNGDVLSSQFSTAIRGNSYLALDPDHRAYVINSQMKELQSTVLAPGTVIHAWVIALPVVGHLVDFDFPGKKDWKEGEYTVVVPLDLIRVDAPAVETAQKG